MPNKITWILDPGHGGMAAGQYLTPGKRSPQVPPGIYEGEFNRRICYNIASIRDDVVFTAPGPINIPLSARVKFVNQLHRRLGNCVLISIHANAAGKPGWSKAKGFRVFYSENNRISKESKQLARVTHSILSSQSCINPRTVKKANFTIIRRVKCPAILVELGFMTNRDEAEHLNSVYIQRGLASLIDDTMTRYESEVKP